MATSAGYGFVRARTDIPAVTWLEADGAVTRIVRWKPTLAYSTDETWDRFERNLREDYARVNPRLQGEELDGGFNRQLGRFSVDLSVPLPLFGEGRKDALPHFPGGHRARMIA